MNARQHWESVYGSKAPDQVSWYRPHLETSLSYIERAAPETSRRIIDVGGGESTLVDDLLARGYEHLTVLDISRTAIEFAKTRLGAAANRVRWLVDDITTANLPVNEWDVWHDRAVFHFLASASDRASYVKKVRQAVRPGGHVIVSTFGPEGPTKCSGLHVQRYDADSLHSEFGRPFRLIDSSEEIHRTPFGTAQQFLYCFCVVE